MQSYRDESRDFKLQGVLLFYFRDASCDNAKTKNSNFRRFRAIEVCIEARLHRVGFVRFLTAIMQIIMARRNSRE